MSVYSGVCGDNLQWALIVDPDSNISDLVIRGSGDMFDYDRTDNYPPWEWAASNIRAISLPTGLTSIGNHAFEGTSISTIHIPENVSRIGESSFSNTILSSLTLSAEISEIGRLAFLHCSDLTSIKMNAVPDTIGAHAFQLGYPSTPVTCTVSSPENIADGALSEYADEYTTFIYQATGLTTYDYLSRGNTKLQVESAVRDAKGRRIDTNYPVKKKEEEWYTRLYSVGSLTLTHNLYSPPSSVMVFAMNPDTHTYTQIYADVDADDNEITIRFSTIPSYGSKLLIKALI